MYRILILILISFIFAASACAQYSADDEEPTTVYHAEETEVRLFGDTAVVAFRLVATTRHDSKDEDEVETTYFLNTGMFAKGEGNWQAVAWQSTRMPD